VVESDELGPESVRGGSPGPLMRERGGVAKPTDESAIASHQRKNLKEHPIKSTRAREPLFSEKKSEPGAKTTMDNFDNFNNFDNFDIIVIIIIMIRYYMKKMNSPRRLLAKLKGLKKHIERTMEHIEVTMAHSKVAMALKNPDLDESAREALEVKLGALEKALEALENGMVPVSITVKDEKKREYQEKTRVL
jgi:hypothetical protein